MPRAFHAGEQFSITNCDYNIVYEEWTVVSVEDLTITFSCTKRYAVDIAYVLPSATETVVGTVVRNDGDKVVIAFSQYSGMEVGLYIEGNKATYLRDIDPLRYA